jgi:epoxyqueuosine reductase
MKPSNIEDIDSMPDYHIPIENILHTVRRPSCCSFWIIAVSDLATRENKFLNNFMPDAETAIVIGHHIVTKQEWKWYATANGGDHCAADDHTKDMCMQLKEIVATYGFSTEIVPYPRESGLQFRFVAQAAGAGEIGINAFLLHPEWGPWIHLRVLATQAVTKTRPTAAISVCNSCDACITACPAGAIGEKTFDGLQCRSHRKAKGEYIPVGPMRELRYCTICADICPIGQKPEEIKYVD